MKHWKHLPPSERPNPTQPKLTTLYPNQQPTTGTKTNNQQPTRQRTLVGAGNTLTAAGFSDYSNILGVPRYPNGMIVSVLIL